ncbi:hypothetical protein BU24DRAFT_427997 [Aaosphaeria arxii CBS 175.79]|uniref:F-box domain-containing protein n=1 Tax=Aaosphaeria arxii CBS 175.79 TaxID=1450172 RepID=A0A6A5XAT3_9PLEO|nr:uncharacterized protein BU24DRAFT_427997 [Aaosphaeria arxii CBS 175.79]KAF2009956.1 hypothetical protein BU24DRAFT_427997 [Aaosphaeria arxii CBS 175.79]
MDADTDSSTSVSRETSPDAARPNGTQRDGDITMSEPIVQDSPFLRLPVDIFKCISDYLDRDSAWSLKRLCKGMSQSKLVNELLYKYPLQWNDVSDLCLRDWKYGPTGQQRWEAFQESIDDSNRNYVHRLSMSHWSSIQDFRWIEENLPSLTCLDISSIKDFVWTPEETWTWTELANACPKLFGRLEELEVANWADYTNHSRISYAYSYEDYRFKTKFRLSRRQGGGSVAKILFPICTTLKTLSIREKYSGYHSWDEFEVHQRVCLLVNGIEENCPPTLTKLRVYDFGPYRSLFCTDVTSWGRLHDIEISLYDWLDGGRGPRELFAPIPYRIMPGDHRREDEEVFDDKTFETCGRNHMEVGKQVVSGVNASFIDVLQNLRTSTQKFSNIKVTPMSFRRSMEYQPLQLINASHRRRHVAATPVLVLPPPADPISSPDVQDALRWLAQTCGWKPALSWESLMCDVYPENLDSRYLLPKVDLIARIEAMMRILKSIDIPIRLLIGSRRDYNAPEVCLFFGDYKSFEGEGEGRREVLAPTQARCNLSGVAELVDELTISYPYDVPGVATWNRSKRASDAEKQLIDREKVGWRRFWKRYALKFKNLKKLTVTVPLELYNDWVQSQEFAELLADKGWEMLTLDDQSAPVTDIMSRTYPITFQKFSFVRKRHCMEFVRRVFFREDTQELHLNAPNLTSEQLEGREILDSEIADLDNPPAHRFWPATSRKAERVLKRKSEHDGPESSAKRPTLETS